MGLSHEMTGRLTQLVDSPLNVLRQEYSKHFPPERVKEWSRGELVAALFGKEMAEAERKGEEEENKDIEEWDKEWDEDEDEDEEEMDEGGGEEE